MMGFDFFRRPFGAFLCLFSAFVLIAVVPFLSNWRTGPLNSFYLESGALLFALWLVLLTFLTGRLNAAMPRGTVYFLSLAAYWWLQARIMSPVYPGQSGIAAWAFMVLALTLWACRGWVADLGQEKVVAALAWALLAGGCLQAAVVWVQYAGWTKEFGGILSWAGRSNLTGQLGQRNHLGHYLMWSLLAASYLWAGRRLPAWLGLPAVAYLALTMGLVNSRAILLYVAAVFALALCWRLRQGKEGGRVFAVFSFAAVMVLAVQFSLNTVLGWLGADGVETALQRAGGSSFAMSARDLEWRNAWHVFLASPMWGHGWDSFALQGFLNASYPHGFSPNGISVLFTHSHNIVLQLLAEMGLAGTSLVLGGALWVVWPYFRRPATAENLLPLALISVSLCHSMVEYPLWYLYFLVPFAVMMGLTPSRSRSGKAAYGPKPMLLAAAALVIAAGIVRLGFTYRELTTLDRRVKNENAAEIGRKIQGLQKIAAREPLLAYYAELSLTHRASPSEIILKPWAWEVSTRAHRHRPYATAYQYALYEYRRGDKKQAAAWLNKLYRYYPTSMKTYASHLHNSMFFQPLYEDLVRACTAYRQWKPDAPDCLPK
ncbi:MAG: Wzy polymerase domain-containing protein [Neisseria sp.]|nr:Wzy polymerase domain-containing protein [Neisseria sp.]